MAVTDEEKFNFWKAMDVDPAVIAAADQAEMSARAAVDTMVEKYREFVTKTENAPLTAIAIVMFKIVRKAEIPDQMFLSFVLADAIRRSYQLSEIQK